MKQKLSQLLLFAVCNFCIALTITAQNITTITNPNSPGSFTWVNGGALSGYSGTPIIFNNTLVLEYNGSTTANPAIIKQQLAVYNGGNNLQLITNPDAGQGVYFQSIQIIFNNKLFFIYLDVSGVQRLASFDGTSITLYPNPDASSVGFVGSPRIYNNNLYVAYVNAAGSTQFGLFTGSGISLIPNPDASTVGFYNDYSVVFNNLICSRYVTAGGSKHLATFDGTSWTVWPNPDATTRGFYPDFPAVYHNKLYWMYYSATNQYQYAQWDGATNPTLIANPQSSGSNNGGVTGLPIIFNDTLFFQYYNTANVLQLAKFGGTSISLIPNPDATTYGYWNTPVLYNNSLYIFYLPVNGTHHIAQYQGTTNSLTVYPNPDAGLGYWDKPIVYGSNLYFMYYNALSVFQLGSFDGSTISLISNPTGGYTGAAGNNGYTGYPIIWNSNLYMQFGSVPYANAGNLAYYNNGVLPVSLLNFTAQKNANTSLLQWQTANELNNAYFSIERSADGINFQPIAKVAGHGNLSIQQNYQFTDNSPVTGLNYYRLKQVDNNGHFTYSNIVVLNFNTTDGNFNLFPNPVQNTVTLSLPPFGQATTVINVFDINGKKVLEKRINGNVLNQTIDVRNLAKGIYQVTLVQGNQQQTVKMIKQ